MKQNKKNKQFELRLHFIFGGFCSEKRHQIQSSANAKIVTTKKDLQKLTVVVRHGFDKKQKLRVERLTSDFQEVVGLYSTCQQVSYLKQHI